MVAEKIKIAVVGGGGRGVGMTTGVIQRIERFELVAYCEKHPVRRKYVHDSVKLPEHLIYESFDEMLEKCSIDVVFVCVEPLSAAELCIQALHAGKDVMTDVPLSYTLKDCWDMLVAVEETGKTFKMVEQMRFCRFIEDASRMNREGEFGKIVFMEGQYIHDVVYNRSYWDTVNSGYCNPAQAEEFGNCVRSQRVCLHPLAYNPHEMSPLLKVANDRVATVSCMGTRMGSYSYPIDDVIDAEMAVMRTENDILIRIINSFSVPYVNALSHWYNIVGSKASMETSRATWDTGKIWEKPEISKQYDFSRLEGNLLSVPEQTELSKTSAHGGLDYLPFINYIEHVDGTAPLDMDIYTACEATAPGIVAGISAAHQGLPFAVPDFRPNADRKLGDAPKSYKAKSIYGDIHADSEYESWKT